MAWADDGRVRRRTQSSVAVSTDREVWALLNCAPEILKQIADNPPLAPQRGLRHSPITAVLLTNGDIDHVAGLLSLRESQSFALRGTSEVLAVIADNPVFGVLAPTRVERAVVALDEAFPLLPDLEARIFAVPGKVPLYLETDAVDVGAETAATIGVEMEADGRRAYYIPCCARMTPALAGRLAGADLVLFDGTFWRDDEMIAAGVGTKTGRRMGHMAMAGAEGSIAAFRALDVGQKIFVHVNNTNPVLIEGSPERRQAEAAGWCIAEDGMDFAL